MNYEVIIDRGETANKCTIAPLNYRTDFKLIRVKGGGTLGPLQSPILLHHGGQCYTEIKKQTREITGFACIDCIWRRLDPILSRVSKPHPLKMRIPEGFVTAYPRKSDQELDPDGGLATIEAIFIAAALFNHWDVTLLSEYYFGQKFIDINTQKMKELGIFQDERPIFRTSGQTSRARRERRGRFSAD